LAEWLRSGLQSRLHRFDSGRRLLAAPRTLIVGALVGLAALCGAVPTPAGSASPPEGYFRPVCKTGTAKLGDRPGRILFAVRCVRRHGHKFRFVVSRGDRRGEHVTISSFSLEPATRGAGAVYRRGRCQRLRQEIACMGYGDGRVTLRGWLAVPPVHRCRSKITMTQGVQSRCNPNKGQICPAIAVMDTIFNRLPAGC
jgi:hypothetical protein